MDDLPDELLLHIFSYLDPPVTFTSPRYEGTNYLAKICLVSRRFNAIATPLLYKVIEAHSVACLASLLQTLMLYPVCREHIKTIRQITPNPTQWGRRRQDDHLELLEIDKRRWIKVYCDDSASSMSLLEVADFHQLFPDHSPDDLYQRTAHGDDVQVALVASMAPNLEQLFIKPAHHHLFEQLPYWLETLTFKTASNFNCLKVLVVDLKGTACGAVPLLFNLPRLVDLTLIHFDGRPSYFNPTSDWPIGISGVKSLSLRLATHFSQLKSVENTIDACKALSSFEITLLSSLAMQEPQYPNVISALKRHGNTLEKLFIGWLNAQRFNWSMGHVDIWDSYFSPNDFTNLKVLRVPLHLLFKSEDRLYQKRTKLTEVIPPNIESLILEFPNAGFEEKDNMDHHFLGLHAAYIDGRLPHLRSIYVRYTQIHLDCARNLNFRHMQKLFKADGIDFNVFVYIIWPNNEPNEDILLRLKRDFPEHARFNVAQQVNPYQNVYPRFEVATYEESSPEELEYARKYGYGEYLVQQEPPGLIFR